MNGIRKKTISGPPFAADRIADIPYHLEAHPSDQQSRKKRPEEIQRKEMIVGKKAEHHIPRCLDGNVDVGRNITSLTCRRALSQRKAAE